MPPRRRHNNCHAITHRQVERPVITTGACSAAHRSNRPDHWGGLCWTGQLLENFHPSGLLRRESGQLSSFRSSSERKCSVIRVHSRFGDRCFAAAGRRIWNNLPASLWDKELSCTEFRRQLKTFMFQADCGASWLSWLLHLINTLTYLLNYLSSRTKWQRLPAGDTLIAGRISPVGNSCHSVLLDGWKLSSSWPF